MSSARGRSACMLGGRGCARSAFPAAAPRVWAATTVHGQPCAPLAQSAERLHGKEKVYGSIP